jgi:NADPH2:quinone reductase
MISPKPEAYSFEEAAAFKTAYLTAYVGLIRRGQLQRGETLLVHGASGGVGMAAVQLGKLYGARVIATGTSNEKLEVVKSWGADEVLNIYENEKVNFKDRVKDLTNGMGADVIYDPVGGEVFDQSIRCINWGGRLLIIGFAGGTIPTLPVNYPLIKGFSVVGVRAGEFGRRAPILGKENIDIINSLADDNKIRPHICKVFDYKESKQALEYLENRKLIGKVVISIN